MRKTLTFALMLFLTVSLLITPALGVGYYLADPNTGNKFTTVEGDGNLNYNFKDSGGAWANIMNPWGASVFMLMEPSEGFVQSYIITFRIEGYDGGDEGYRVMCGFGINGWCPSLWSIDSGMDDGANWEEIFGEKYYYYIDGDGVYQFIVSFRHAMDWFEANNDWYIKDYLESIDCIELGIYGPSEDSTMALTLLGIEETGDIFSLENISRPIGSGKFIADSESELPALPDPEPSRPPRYDSEDGGDNAGESGDTDVQEPSEEPSEEPSTQPSEPPASVEPSPAASSPPPASSSPAPAGSDGGNWWIWVIAGVGAVIIVVIVSVVVRKKK